MPWFISARIVSNKSYFRKCCQASSSEPIRRVFLYLDPELYDAIHEDAKRERRTFNGYIKVLIEKHLKKLE